jgi:hypothetical protein
MLIAGQPLRSPRVRCEPRADQPVEQRQQRGRRRHRRRVLVERRPESTYRPPFGRAPRTAHGAAVLQREQHAVVGRRPASRRRIVRRTRAAASGRSSGSGPIPGTAPRRSAPARRTATVCRRGEPTVDRRQLERRRPAAAQPSRAWAASTRRRAPSWHHQPASRGRHDCSRRALSITATAFSTKLGRRGHTATRGRRRHAQREPAAVVGAQRVRVDLDVPARPAPPRAPGASAPPPRRAWPRRRDRAAIHRRAGRRPNRRRDPRCSLHRRPLARNRRESAPDLDRATAAFGGGGVAASTRGWARRPRGTRAPSKLAACRS